MLSDRFPKGPELALDTRVRSEGGQVALFATGRNGKHRHGRCWGGLRPLGFGTWWRCGAAVPPQAHGLSCAQCEMPRYGHAPEQGKCCAEEEAEDMHRVLAATRVRVDEEPEFGKVFGPDAISDIALAWADAYVCSGGDEEFLKDLTVRGLVQAGWPRGRADELVEKLAGNGTFRRAVLDAIVREMEERLEPTARDLEEAIKCRLDPYGWSAWEEALGSLGEMPVCALSCELAPERLACPWPAGVLRDLEDLVDTSWVKRMAAKAMENSRVSYEVCQGMVIDLKLHASPELIELLGLTVQIRGGFALPTGAPLEEVLAAAALSGQDPEKLLRPFRNWLKELARNLAWLAVRALCRVVDNRFQQVPVDGKYVVEALDAMGLLPRECSACPV